jgi:hypothetical protein
MDLSSSQKIEQAREDFDKANTEYLASLVVTQTLFESREEVWAKLDELLV